MKNIIKRLIYFFVFWLVALEHQFRHQASRNVVSILRCTHAVFLPILAVLFHAFCRLTNCQYMFAWIAFEIRCLGAPCLLLVRFAC